MNRGYRRRKGWHRTLCAISFEIISEEKIIARKIQEWLDG
jgi:hypothetical protein